MVRPFASLGNAGITTVSPGKCASGACRLCECVAPCPQPLPITARTTIGTLPARPMNM